MKIDVVNIPDSCQGELVEKPTSHLGCNRIVYELYEEYEKQVKERFDDVFNSTSFHMLMCLERCALLIRHAEGWCIYLTKKQKN